MDTITLIISAALFIALACFIALLLLRIRNNVITGQGYRRALQAELSKLRLNNMIGALGINRERYLHQQSTLDIHQHMERCKSCSNTGTCDDKLGKNLVDKDNFEFCSNAEAFGTISKQQDETD